METENTHIFLESSSFHSIVWAWLTEHQKNRMVMKYDLLISLTARKKEESKRDIYKQIAAKKYDGYRWRWEIVEKIAVNELKNLV